LNQFFNDCDSHKKIKMALIDIFPEFKATIELLAEQYVRDGFDNGAETFDNEEDDDRQDILDYARDYIQEEEYYELINDSARLLYFVERHLEHLDFSDHGLEAVQRYFGLEVERIYPTIKTEWYNERDGNAMNDE